MAPKISATCLAEYQKIRRGEVDSLIGECFERLRGTLQTDGERIQREIEQYNAPEPTGDATDESHLSESVEKVRASVDRPHGGTSGKKKIVLSDVVRLAEKPRRACTLRMWQPLICGVPMKPGNRPPKIKRRQSIPARKCVILPERCG